MSTCDLASKRFVEKELPDLAAVRDAGIDLDLEQACLVHMLLSRTIVHGESKARQVPAGAMRMIVAVVTARVRVGAGELLPSLVTDAGTLRFPAGNTALKRLGIESRDISLLWDESPTFATSCLPLGWVLEFAPPPLWPYVAALVNCDPSEFLPRVHEALKQLGTHRGPGSLVLDVNDLWVVVQLLVSLRSEVRTENVSRESKGLMLLAVPHALDSWTALPPRPKPREIESKSTGGRGRQEVSAVPLEAVQHALSDHARKANWGKWKPDEWPFNRSWRSLKDLVVLCLLVTVCPRADHLRLFDVDDFEPLHTFEDGSSGPGFRFRRSAMKNGRRNDDVYWKRLPDLVGSVLTAWINCSGREIGQAGAPLIIARCIRKPGEPGGRYASGTVSRLVGGSSGGRPLVALPGEEWRGYNPHRFRRTVMQTVERLFAAWKLDNPSEPLAAYDPKVFGELAIDHKVSDMGYRDFTDRKRLEEIVALAISLNWAEFWGDGLHRRGLDPEAITAARLKHAFVEAELERTEHELSGLETEELDVLRRARTVRAERDHVRALLEAQTIGSEIRQQLRRELRLKDELRVAQAKLEEARTKVVALPEDIDGDEYERRLAEALSALDGSAEFEAVGAVAAPMADELAVADLGELFGVTEMTIRRWRSGQSHPPINQESWVRVNAKDWRFPVSAIDSRSLARITADDPQEALDAVRRKRAALGFAKRKTTRPARVTRAA
jgi:hypothetical protein